jgi:class 3 adenylate cyclase
LADLDRLTNDVLARLRDAPTAPDGTVTIMFTDIVSSTAIKKFLGDTDAEQDAAWIEQFQTPHHAIIRACISECDGFEVKTTGDAFFVTFVDPAKAVRSAVEIQR